MIARGYPVPSRPVRSTLRTGDLVPDHTARLLRADGFVAKARPLSGTPGAVHLVTVDGAAGPSLAALQNWLSELTAQGVRLVRTGALGPTTCSAYEEAGFAMRQELALLSHPLTELPQARAVPRPTRLRRPVPHDPVALAMIDRRAFGATWGLDIAGIVDACHATPVHRLRVAATRRLACGYAISGRAGRNAYLQRLAVDPSIQGAGIGRALVVDSLKWAARHRATSLVVNTHVDNEPALHLYRSLGFVELSYRLGVLERKLS